MLFTNLEMIMYPIIKRIIDIIVSIIAMPFLLVFTIVFGILIYIEDKGSIFYRAPRIGRNSKKFYMLKFRSMKVNAPDIRNSDGSTFNSNTDPRVTKIGRFLRMTSLDETAQFINVFKGDMSLIGPRASTWDALPTYKPDEIDKMNVRPGITGYTQAYYRNSISVREKRLYDAWYAHNVSFGLDMKIFFKTILTVLSHRNLYTNKEDNSAAVKSDSLGK